MTTATRDTQLRALFAEDEEEPPLRHDSSTNRLIQRYRKLRRGAT